MSAVVDFPVKPEARPYLDAFGERGDEPDWLRGCAGAASPALPKMGFPSRRGEAWRYLDLRPLEQAPLLPARNGAVAVDRMLRWRCWRDRFRPGRRSPGAGRWLFCAGTVGHRTRCRPACGSARPRGDRAERPELVEAALDALCA